ncbi:probable mitochondrial adenine nucleotide transporter BTL3 [Aristolochia californica]|uniref:probable mitochondrial adenine nucleotide transporter BTL3 n=1 Tax=Aristolochia californica TaxID=171875 RepID=UPI0035D9B1AE
MTQSSSSSTLIQKYFPKVQLSYEASDDFLFTPISGSAFSSAVLQSCLVEKSRNSLAFNVLSELQRMILNVGFIKRNGPVQEKTRLPSSATCLALRIKEGEEEEEKRKKFEGRGPAVAGNSVGKSSWDDMPKFLLAGAISTIFSRTCVAPLERLKLECIIQGSRLTWLKTIQWIWVSEGILGFWKGNLLNLFRMVPFKSINFVCYDMYCDRLVHSRGSKEITSHDRLIGGGISGIVATVVCLPLDTIRTRLVAPGGEALGGVVGCFINMVQNEGLLSLYKGLTPALISMGPASAVFYAVYDVLKASYLSKQMKKIRYEKGEKKTKEGELGAARTLIYGAIAGAIAETVTYPLEVMRRQQQLQRVRRLGLVAAFVNLIEKQGVGSLFAGLVPSALQVLPSAALSYLFYEMMKSNMKIN